MMKQYSDLSVSKMAKQFDKKQTVSETQSPKTVSVMYSKSKTARCWDSSTESRSGLFTLPGLSSHPASAFETFDTTVTSPVVTSEFKLPPWITGKIPVHSLYQQVLGAVTRGNVISTELVYQILMQSGLPKETLGYIWELCNRHTRGQLIREELFLILAMVSIAQNGLDYSSLAILSKCPQPPVPNLGQFLGPRTQQQTTSFSGTALVDHSVASTTAVVHTTTYSYAATLTSGLSGPTIYSQGTGSSPAADLSFPRLTSEIGRGPEHVQDLGCIADRGATMSVNGFSGDSCVASDSVVSQSTADDDEFEKFQTAPLPLRSSTRAGLVNVSSHQSNKLASCDGEIELMKTEGDKYAAFRELSSLSSIEPEAAVTMTALENSMSSTVADATEPDDIADSDFTDFLSFSDASKTDVPVPVLSTFPSSSVNLLQSHSACDLNSAVKRQGSFSSLGSPMKSTSDSNGCYKTVKSPISDPSVFATKPIGAVLTNHMSSLCDNVVRNRPPRGNGTVEDDGEYAVISSAVEGYMSSLANQNYPLPPVPGYVESFQETDVDSKCLDRLHEAEGWTDFESASTSCNGHGVLDVTRSSSFNGLEFTGWELHPGTAMKEPVMHSTGNLEQPRQDGSGSPSVSRFDFPPIELERRSKTDEQSVVSLELKPSATDSDSKTSRKSETSDKVPSAADSLHLPLNLKESVVSKGSNHQVELKDLLEQKHLRSFGDRYSGLTNEVQDGERHACEWLQCLEVCNRFISEGNSNFSSLSSSSVLQEILSTDEGCTYLKGLVEMYLVARRIEEEMRFISVSNSKLMSTLKDINVQWNGIADICAGSPIIPDLSSLSFHSSFLKADDYAAQRKACGVCLLNVDLKTTNVSNGDLGLKSLAFGGRQYHTSCANFWINCVSKTLPSLTIPDWL